MCALGSFSESCTRELYINYTHRVYVLNVLYRFRRERGGFRDLSEDGVSVAVGAGRRDHDAEGRTGGGEGDEVGASHAEGQGVHQPGEDEARGDTGEDEDPVGVQGQTTAALGHSNVDAHS